MNNQKNVSASNNRGSLTIGGLLGIGAILAVIVIFFVFFKWHTVEGNSVGVLEDFSGVQAESLPPKTYFWLNGLGKTVFDYPVSGQVLVFNDKTDKQEPFAEGRHSDALEINSLDNQKVRFHAIVTWRIDPLHVVNLHKTYRNNIEERLIRPETVKLVGTKATLQQAIDLYSGPKLNQLRQDVENEMKSPTGKLAMSGIIVDSFIFEKPDFTNQEYVKSIEARQLAIIIESQAREQQKANLALAEAAKSQALILQNQEVVKAETSKKRAILEQEAISEQSIIAAAAVAKNAIVAQNAESEKVILAAKSEAARNVAISEAQKQAELNRAIGILKVGEATAEANKALLASYSVPGSELYTRIQVAQSVSNSFQNVKGYLPNNVTYNTVASDFNKAVSILVGEPASAAK